MSKQKKGESVRFGCMFFSLSSNCPYCHFLCLETKKVTKENSRKKVMLRTFFHCPRTSARTIGYDLSQIQLLSLYMYLTSLSNFFWLDGALHCAYCRRCPDALLFSSAISSWLRVGKALENSIKTFEFFRVKLHRNHFDCRDRHRVFNINNSYRLA